MHDSSAPLPPAKASSHGSAPRTLKYRLIGSRLRDCDLKFNVCLLVI